jgi:hypothetical protein
MGTGSPGRQPGGIGGRSDSESTGSSAVPCTRCCCSACSFSVARFLRNAADVEWDQCFASKYLGFLVLVDPSNSLSTSCQAAGRPQHHHHYTGARPIR